MDKLPRGRERDEWWLRHAIWLLVEGQWAVQLGESGDGAMCLAGRLHDGAGHYLSRKWLVSELLALQLSPRKWTRLVSGLAHEEMHKEWMKEHENG